MSLVAPLLPQGTLAGPLRRLAEGGAVKGKPRAWALPRSGTPRQGEEGAELRTPRVDPALPGLDLRYLLRVGETALGRSAVPFRWRIAPSPSGHTLGPVPLCERSSGCKELWGCVSDPCLPKTSESSGALKKFPLLHA